jgi:transcriptional regulator with XRE-family HTH domain
MDSEKPLSGGVPMVSIDGSSIRRIREEKGLTQLYVATVVGVTTDTISRWENRRYPNIKKENAVKLAEALETELSDIIDHVQPTPAKPSSLHPPEPPEQEDSTPPPAGPEIQPVPAQAPPQSEPRRSLLTSLPTPLLLAAFLLLGLAGLALNWWFTANNGEGQVAAYRTLPAHATPGIPFPIRIDVTTSSSTPFSLILKESLPPDCIPAQGQPRFVSQEGTPPVLKWISKITGDHAVYSYLVRLRPEAKLETVHRFSGEITVRSDNNPSIRVSGSDALLASPFHWADGNSDGRIDDEELLSVYETYGEIEDLHFGMKLIEEIWAANGYRWDPERRSYEILQ